MEVEVVADSSSKEEKKPVEKDPDTLTLEGQFK